MWSCTFDVVVYGNCGKLMSMWLVTIFAIANRNYAITTFSLGNHIYLSMANCCPSVCCDGKCANHTKSRLSAIGVKANFRLRVIGTKAKFRLRLIGMKARPASRMLSIPISCPP